MDITRCEVDGQGVNLGVMAAIYHAVCDGHEISRGVRRTDSEITWV